ncbi:hypothetical protein VB780_28360 [Leptolyngbya sp. CCNP1308]|uniref:hypothetical protein n=1 Tax=Leptolyngbya sp. CCNP1308 TaxID=3110255 RepID=UPI002B1ECD2B|nr:hypothetical protein [Leptolyngbya sp. CCNP1308]MEA5452519.1 hypothetical protein [Leptolyngbya sp. CCNP1308]
MNNQTNQAWTTEQLVQMSNSLGNAYAPALKGTKAAGGDRWTAQRHIQVSAMLGQAYL